MKCPTCGLENPDKAQQCVACGQALPASQAPAPTVEVRVSRIAIASSIAALICIILFIPIMIVLLAPTVMRPESDAVGLIGLVGLLSGGTAFCLGIAGILVIACSGGRRTGSVFAVFGVVVPTTLVLGVISLPALLNVGGTAYRMTCGTNLSAIGKAMGIYANDYGDTFPTAGGSGARWAARLPSWAAQNRAEAYGWSDPNGGGGQASVSASLYLLVKYTGLEPKKFVCKNDGKIREFNSGKYGLRGREPRDLWDFGPNPAMHCSYAYHLPYGPNRLTTSLPPGFAIAADRNPWMDSPSGKTDDFSRFKPDVAPFLGMSDDARRGNAAAHDRDGQNVLFLDSHVEFARRAYCGLDDDNIYTSWNGTDKLRGTAPSLGSQPADPLDSLLVNDPPVAGGN